MIRTKIARVSGLAIGAAMVLGFASQAGAVTIADLQAQIAALTAQLMALSGGSVAAAPSAAITSDLTVGSSGSQVSALQNALIAQGYLHVSATGTFGPLTKAAVMAWQAASGLPSTGFFGPLSRARFNGSASGTTTGGTTVGGVTTGGTIGTTASCSSNTQEGILNVTAGPISNTVVNVGAMNANVITVRAQAQSSNIAIERIQLDLGTNTNIYNKIFSALHVVDKSTGQILATTPLNSSTVVQSGSDYIVNLSGFNIVVPANTYKDIAITADLYSSIDSAYISGGLSAVTDTFTVVASGVRGTDCAGIDQYSPVNSFSQTVTVNKSLVDNAQAQVALAPSSPLANSVPVTDTVNGQFLQLPLLAFNVTAQNDTLHLHNLAVTVIGSPASGLTTATATTAYLYNGSTQVASASINTSTGVATFSNIADGTAGASIPAGQTTTFTIKADVTGVLSKSINVSANFTAAGTTIYNSTDSTVTPTGTANGNIVTVLGSGPSFALNGTPSLVIAGTNTNTTSGVSTSTLTASFNVNVTAVGSPIALGTQASTTNPTFVFGIYKGGVLVAPLNVSTSSFFQTPQGVVTSGLTNSFILGQNQTVTLPVTFSFDDRLTTAALTGGQTGNTPFTVDIERLQWVGADGTIKTTTFPAGQTVWTTNQVVGAAR